MTDNQDSTLSVQELGSRLYDCADYLRGHVDKAEYKDYILPLVFYAEVNRRFKQNYNQEQEELDADVSEDVVDETLREIAAEDTVDDILIPKQYEWSHVIEHTQEDTEESLVNFISDAFHEFEHENGEYGFSEMFDTNPVSDASGQEAIKNVVTVIDDTIYQSEETISPDLLGEAFMYLLKQFAREEAGEYFTPPRVVRLVVELVEPFDHNSSVHDPTVGSGGMLTEAATQILGRRDSGYYQEHFGDDLIDTDSDKEFLTANGFTFSGQELNPRIVSLAKMNLAINNLDGDIRRGNSLTHPQFTENNSTLTEFDYILANFPFSENGWKSVTKDRADKYGDMD